MRRCFEIKETERFVAESSKEIIWLRINRFKSVKLCEKILNNKNNMLYKNKVSQNIIAKKAIGLSSAIESAIGFWNQKPDSLNLKILSRYYALLQFTIAEQVGSLKVNDGLKEIQKHTEHGGHGLGIIKNKETPFPKNFYIYILNGGHFFSYTKFLGYDINKMHVKRKPKKYKNICKEDKSKLILLIDLLRRIPELQQLIKEYLDLPPLSFQISYNNKKLENTKKNIDEYKTTYLSITPSTNIIDIKFLEKLNLPINNIIKKDDITGKTIYVGEFKHLSADYWYQHLTTHKSSCCGTSLIAPIYEEVQDYILINLMIMYSLSIIVRYMPDLWHEIRNGKFDHIGSLIEYYLSIFDNVIPLKILERITGKNIRVDMPGSLFGPT